MVQVKFVVADAVTTVIKHMAQARRISEPDVWRMVVARGIEGIELSELSDNLRDEIRKEIGALRTKLRSELLGSVDVSSQPQKYRRKRQHSPVINSFFLISCGNPAIMLELAKHAFDSMPLLIKPIIAVNFLFSVRFRRNHNLYPPCL